MSQTPPGPPPGFGSQPGAHSPASPHEPTQTIPQTGPPPGYPAGPPPFGAAGPGFPGGPGYPGYPGAPGGFGGAGGSGFPPPPRPNAGAETAIWTLAGISLVATVVGLSVQEDGRSAWDSVHAWGALAILGALLTLAPVLSSSISLSAHRAWQVAAGGAGALGLFWVLFVLPAAGSNASLVTTIGAAAGVAAVWIAPGREPASAPRPQVW